MNNIEFVAAAQKLKDEKYGYIWGAKGEVATESLLQRCIRAAKTAGTYTFTDAKIAYARQKLIAAGTRVVDCSGLLTVSAGLSARGSAQIWADCQSKSSEIKDIPNTTGLVVYRPGHIGIYLGSGKVIESGGYSVGVTVTPIAQPATGKAWTGWGYWSAISYDSPVTAPSQNAVDPHLFSVTLKQDMNVRCAPNATCKIITVAKKGLGLGIAEVSQNGNWGRIQNQVNPPQWICISDKYVTRSE